MPFSEHIALPPWCRHMGTTKLLVSSDGHGFALDVGGEQQLQMLRMALADGLIRKIEGIWVTHLHNDHTARVPAAAREFGCPVYAVAEVADGLRRPGAWFLPGLIPEAVDEVVVRKDGENWTWREFTFTSHFFPGQMYNHGGLLVERADHKPVFFIGDSFSPSGIDDYCLMNRNLMREDTGYFLCLRKVRALPRGSWLVNQHIPHLFRFTEQELDYLEERYRKRAAMIADLVPWDDPNYAIDEEWAWFYPYASEARPGERLKVELRLWNHSQRERTFDDPDGGNRWPEGGWQGARGNPRPPHHRNGEGPTCGDFGTAGPRGARDHREPAKPGDRGRSLDRNAGENFRVGKPCAPWRSRSSPPTGYPASLGRAAGKQGPLADSDVRPVGRFRSATRHAAVPSRACPRREWDAVAHCDPRTAFQDRWQGGGALLPRYRWVRESVPPGAPPSRWSPR